MAEKRSFGGGRETRRRFLERAGRAGAAAAAWPLFAPRVLGAGERVRVGVMGTNGRGTALARGFAALGGAEVAWVCDVDSRAVEKAKRAVLETGAAAPQETKDFRRILDDRTVDALVIATPDHWHAPAGILACRAGKHVYVEKPCSHNPREGELLVEAARKHGRVVQHGTQRRSWPALMEAMAKLKEGVIGRVLVARGWYNNTRPSIGRGREAEVPPWLDYDLWQGPAPERPYRDNVIHYNWHWFWHWGTGELGNNGVHALDLCRWGAGVDYPRRVSAGGGMYYFDDDQETPDTHVVTFDCDGCMLVWEGRNWHPRGFEGLQFGASFYGDGGTLVIAGNGYRVYDRAEREIARASGPGGDRAHLEDFTASIRENRTPNADIAEGHKSALLCHLGNIAYRTRKTLEVAPDGRGISGDADAARLWTREYRDPWGRLLASA